MRLDQSIIAGLSELADIPDYLRDVIEVGVISTIDTQMIIDDDDFHAVEQGKAVPEDAAAPFDEIEQRIEQTQDKICAEGFSNRNFHALVRDFGALLFRMIASDAQRAEVASWHEQGLAQFGGFLMSDGGGSSISQWNTVFSKDGEELELNVDKVWIIDGHRLDYGSISSASTQKLYPASILIPPDAFGALRKTAIGKPFLNGDLQLGNVSGKVRVSASWMLASGSLASTSVFLAKARPRFVRALMAHVQWLSANGKLKLKPRQQEGVRTLEAIARRYYHNLVDRKPSLPMALSIKFAANRILLDLVASQAHMETSLRRDLLAFTRMEGSSYRCLFEVYSKVKVR
jgi:hypothetical protein